VLDLEASIGAALWAAHGHIGGIDMDEEGTPLDEWVSAYVTSLQHDLVVDEVGPDGSPAEREAIEMASANQSRQLLFGGVVVAFLIAIGFVAWLALLG
jgi:hypothetical protein